MSSGQVRDFDFHPDENEVRVFAVAPGGVLRFDEQACVYAVRYGDTILWHYAFAQHWFKVNVTTDLDGQIVETGAVDLDGTIVETGAEDPAATIVETGGEDPGAPFAFNCDVATPMRRHDGAVFAVDLFADLLVRADAISYRIGDLDEFGQARRTGLILPHEADGAERGLAELVGLVERGEFLSFLSRAWPIGPLQPPDAVPPDRVRLDQVPLLSRDSRANLPAYAKSPARPA